MNNLFNGYKVTSSHATKTSTNHFPARCRVKDPAGVLVACVAGKRGDVLRAIRYDVFAPERAVFIAQLRSNNVPEEIIKSILSVPLPV